MPRLRLDMPAHLADALSAEADGIGVPVSALATTDLIRYRALAKAAAPKLDKWQRGLLGHVLDGIEAHRILTGDDSLPSAGTIVNEIDTWADGSGYEDTQRAERLRRIVSRMTPLEIAGALMRMRAA